MISSKTNQIIMHTARTGTRVLFTALVIILSFSFGPLALTKETSNPALVLTILHTNDLHAHDEPFEERGRSIGGMARIAYLIRAISKNNLNVLTIDAGDIFQGTPFFRFYHGAVEVALLNQAGYQIYTPGNHEFDEGSQNLAYQLKQAKFDIVSANLDTTKVPDLATIVKPSVIKIINGQKVGFVGAITPDLERSSLKTNGIKVKMNGQDWIYPIAQEVERLEKEGVDKIVLVTHIGLDLDRQLAQAIPAIDIIIGGHSHTRLNSPLLVRHNDGRLTYIVQTGCYGRALGKLQLAFDSHGTIIEPATHYNLINITDKIPEAPDIKAFLTAKRRPFAALTQSIAGVAMGDFDNQFYRYPWDSPIGDLICDALLEAGTSYGATIALQNRGGIRARIERGLINMEKIEEVLPFSNHLALATIDGSTLLKVLEHGLSGNLGGHFLDVKGLKLAYNPNQNPGSRIVFALAKSKTGSWEPIKENAYYKVALNDYTLRGGEGFDFSKATNIKMSEQRLSSVLADYLLKHKKVVPAAPHRLIAVTDNLLRVFKKENSVILKLTIPTPHVQATLALGDGPGIEEVASGYLVPLTHARILAANVPADTKDEISWQLPFKNVRNGTWAVALITSPGKQKLATSRLLITPPICIGQTEPVKQSEHSLSMPVTRPVYAR